MAREIVLTQSRVAIVDDADYEWLSSRCWYAKRGRNTWYAAGTVNGRVIRMHRFILAPLPADSEVHHINGDGLDNRRCNLQVLTGEAHRQKHKPTPIKLKAYQLPKRSDRWAGIIQVSLGVTHASREDALAALEGLASSIRDLLSDR